MDELSKTLKAIDLGKLKTTLMEVVIRDASNNPEIYKQTETGNDLTEIHNLLEKLSPLKNTVGD